MKQDIGKIDIQERKIKLQERFAALLQKLNGMHPKLLEEFHKVPPKHQRLYLDVHCSGQKSYTKSIKLKCLQCQDWDTSQIKICTEKQCPINKIRPYQEK